MATVTLTDTQLDTLQTLVAIARESENFDGNMQEVDKLKELLDVLIAAEGD